jgi:hypothetical protein
VFRNARGDRDPRPYLARQVGQTLCSKSDRAKGMPMIRILVGGFLIAHGLVHLAVWATPKPTGGSFDPSHSWLLGSAKGLSVVIAALATVILVSGGVALFAHAGVWRPLVIGGLAISLLLDLLYFNPWFSFITVVNAGLLLALIGAHWPSSGSVGA